MGKTQEEMDRAVKAGYWQLYRYNPLKGKRGKNPFTLDSKEPDWAKFQQFLDGEVRYTSLKKMFPEEASELFKAAAAPASCSRLIWSRSFTRLLAPMIRGFLRFSPRYLEVKSAIVIQI